MACVNPTIVVLFPSPRGVGVMAVTSMYLPWGLSSNQIQMDLGLVLAVVIEIVLAEA